MARYEANRKRKLATHEDETQPDWKQAYEQVAAEAPEGATSQQMLELLSRQDNETLRDLQRWIDELIDAKERVEADDTTRTIGITFRNEDFPASVTISEPKTVNVPEGKVVNFSIKPIEGSPYLYAQWSTTSSKGPDKSMYLGPVDGDVDNPAVSIEDGDLVA